MPSEKSAPEIQLLEEEQKFLLSAMHDLRASHRGVAIAVQLMAETSDESERADLLKQMTQGLSKTDELLKAIARYAISLTPGKEIATFPAAAAVRFALANLDSEIRATGASVKLGDLPEIQGDKQRLEELFENLLSNSLKFRGDDPPSIEINAQQTPDGFLFSVSDNGVGIPLKYRDRLFVPFRRLHGADVPGVGLGLATSSKIVAGYGGRIWIDNRETGGVTINFLLPIPIGS
jgi:light-regulated signal transduction histidine kinase (bacteriophytochrome)